MTVTKLARDEVVQVAPDEPVAAAVEAMRTHGVGSVVVVAHGEPVGMLTDRDIALRSADQDWDPATPVGELATQPVVTIDEDQGVYDLVRTMAAKGVRRVPVVRDGQLTGIVTLDDVVILLGMELQHVATVLRSEAPPFEVPSTELFDEGSF
ncbi:MAG: CBS domain-containing protein [Halobacteriales archaeon]|nr:CBS domain-containing protein [Halobacteriales archaeon]